MLKICFALLSLVSFAACIWPGGRTITNRTYRGFTVSYDEMENANNETLYAFSYEIADRPKWFFSQSVITSGNANPNITLSGLRINEVISFRVAAYQVGQTIKDDMYSPIVNISVKASNLAGPTLVPGMPLDVVVEDNGSQSTHSAIVRWKDPQNIQDATNAEDKDIQYNIQTCRYNRFTEQRTDCKILAQMLRDDKKAVQSTENMPDNLYRFNLHPGKLDELAFHVTGVSLNGTSGPSAEVIKRLVPANAPQVPTNVTADNIYADQLRLYWVSVKGENYIKYNIKGNTTTMMKDGGSPMTIDGLKMNTTYEFQVGVYTKERGGSDYSTKYTVSTTDEPAPTPKPDPGSNGTMLTSSIFILVASFFTFLKLW